MKCYGIINVQIFSLKSATHLSQEPKNKLALFYFMIGNVSAKYCSSLLNIHFLCITWSKTPQECGAKTVLEPVMKDINYLEEVSHRTKASISGIHMYMYLS
uniref:Uncharacterized protein n=1 Tax=Amphimedon queenslandica TaxID=400682 RepID=A0A1X7SZZ1_AMPQE